MFSRPRGNEIFEVTGKLLGKRLFFDKTETMDYTMLPYVLITPIEYAFIGISEDGALHRFPQQNLTANTLQHKILNLIRLPVLGLVRTALMFYKPRSLRSSLKFPRRNLNV